MKLSSDLAVLASTFLYSVYYVFQGDSYFGVFCDPNQQSVVVNDFDLFCHT